VRATLASVVTAAALAAGIARAGPADTGTDATLAALVAGLDPRAGSAIERIEGTGRRLLAARAYLRAGAGLDGRWSWSLEQAAAFENTAEKRALDDAVACVRREFESRNPGYTIWVNPEFRSIDVQIERWNGNESVALAGESLRAAAVHALRGHSGGTPQAVAALRELLLTHAPQPPSALAAPGLSPHGRLRAIDFQVESAGRIVAGTDTASIATEWVTDGWKARLRDAVTAADAGFEGPLASPDEPWHYEYRPQPERAGQEGGHGCHGA
jgi:hypothetical protein